MVHFNNAQKFIDILNILCLLFRHNDVADLTVWLRKGDTTARPSPAADSKIVSTFSRLFLKYCPIITSRLFCAMEVPTPMKSPDVGQSSQDIPTVADIELVELGRKGGEEASKGEKKPSNNSSESATSQKASAELGKRWKPGRLVLADGNQKQRQKPATNQESIVLKTTSLETAIEKVLRVTKEKIVGLKIIPR